MGVGGCLGSGAIQNHLVGFQLGTILTDQSHISKVGSKSQSVNESVTTSLLDRLVTLKIIKLKLEGTF